jgi:pSer/pThr/pTyr-binding forkhead associated (FHA) protein
MLKPGLEIVSKGEVVERVILNRHETKIGRRDDNDIVLSNVSVSRYHARIVDEGGQFHVIDVGSANGVILNGKRISERAMIKLGDEIAVGKFVLRFCELDTQRADVRSGQAADAAPAAPGSTFEVGGDAARRLRESVREGADPEDTRFKSDASGDAADTLPPGKPLPSGAPRRVLKVYEQGELRFEKAIEHVPVLARPLLGQRPDPQQGRGVPVPRVHRRRRHALHVRGPGQPQRQLRQRREGEERDPLARRRDQDRRLPDRPHRHRDRRPAERRGPRRAREELGARRLVRDRHRGPHDDEQRCGGARRAAGRQGGGRRGGRGHRSPAAGAERPRAQFEFPVKDVAVSIQFLGWVTSFQFQPDTLQRAEGHDAARDLVTIRLDMGDRVLSRTIPIASLDLEARNKK